MKKRVFFFVFVIAVAVKAQSADSLSLQQVIDEYVKAVADDENASSVAEYLEELANEKIDLNSADYIELSKIPFLNYEAVSEIISYRERKGKFKSTEELYNTGVPASVISRAKWFLKISDNEKRDFENSLTAAFRTRAVFSGKEIPRDDFSFLKTYSRLLAEYNANAKLALVTEKDAYEKNYADFKSFSFSYVRNDFLRKVILGNYVIEFGQGLVAWSPYAFSKGSDIKTSVIKNGKTVSAYKSKEENRFFQGASVTLGWRRLDFTLFYSDKKYDAIVSDGIFSEISQSGLHIDEADFLRAGALNIKAAGGVFAYSRENLRLSVLAMRNLFSERFVLQSENSDFGKEADYYSAEVKYGFENLFLISEVASNGKGAAQFYSLQFKLSKRLFLITAYRNYSPEYYSLFAKAFGEYGKGSNEKGFFTGAVLNCFVGRFSAYHDIYSTLAPTQLIPFTVGGNEFFFDYISKSFGGNRIAFRVKREKKEFYETAEEFETKRKIASDVTRIRAGVSSRVSRNFTVKTRFDATLFSEEEERISGYAISETVIYKTRNFSFVGFLSVFDTENYDSRIYVYEYDLDGVFTNAMFYGKGIRYYFLIKWKVFGGVKINLKFGETYKREEFFIDASGDYPVRTFGLQFEFNPNVNF